MTRSRGCAVDDSRGCCTRSRGCCTRSWVVTRSRGCTVDDSRGCCTRSWVVTRSRGCTEFYEVPLQQLADLQIAKVTDDFRV